MSNQLSKVASATVLVGAVLASFVAGANATVYDPNAQFNEAPWSYSTTPAAALSYSASLPYLGFPGISTANPIPYFAYVVPNTTGGSISAYTVVDPDKTLWMDPESYSDIAVTFTAPAAGKYTITGEFLGIDTTGNSHGVEILDGIIPINSGLITGYGSADPFNLSETLSAGGTISFLVDSPGTTTSCGYGYICYLGTGLQATISSTPLPSTWTMLIAGFIGFGFVSYRGSKKRAAAIAAA